MPKFDPYDPTDYYRTTYAGGPEATVDKKVDYGANSMINAALVIQRLYKAWKARKNVQKRKIDAERKKADLSRDRHNKLR